MTAEKTAEPRKIAPLPQDRIEEAAIRRTECIATVPHGTLPEDLLRPEFWKHAQATPQIRLQPRYKMEVWSEDMTWYAEYLVLSVADKMVRLHGPMNLQKFDDGKGDVPGFKAQWVVGARMYRNIRLVDKEPIGPETGFPTKEDAQAWQWKNLAHRSAA